ncbi:ParB/RepB/Spo0J family partition protein [Zhongshania sp. BJYM1]|uniref:ParB/RepB/Spo0J family partition protein n=1 Tax=Zhongshania aquatica TaxID=2965069 RepID=UPI0022B35921|nr:ParB/RepB/Spo0J family partition protein [Marortus sp. BJYM1]
METKIALSHLKISPLNVRVVSPGKEEDKQLIASIAAHGILQNLVVVPVDGEDGLYEVVAGGRRLSAIKHLFDSGVLAADYLVPCQVKDAANATEYSIAENMKANMHPADLFISFKSLIDQGRTAKDISIRFGRSQKDVKQILRLADVSPMIFEAYRKGEIDLDVVMAFTVTDDLDKQESVYRDMGGRYMNAHGVKSRLVNTSLTDKSPMSRFVSIKAYEKEGGSVSCDLFDEVKYIDDAELMERLATEKMNGIAEVVKGEGWKWVETTLTSWMDVRAQRTDGELRDVPAELTQKLDAAKNELEKVSKAAYDEEDDDKRDDLWEKETELEQAVESLEEELDGYRIFTDEQKAISGAAITLSGNGAPEITYGYVRTADLPKTANVDGSGSAAATELNGDPDESINLSNALRTDLANYELLSIRSVLMSKPDLCFDLSAFTLAKSVLSFGYYSRASSLSLNIVDMSATKDIEETIAAKAILEAKEKLNLSWLDAESDLDMFINFQMLSRTEKKAIHAFCVAASLTSSNNDIVQSLAEQVKFNLADHWQPTKENYFNRIKKDDILLIAKDLKGEEFAAQHSSAKKGDLAGMVAGLDEVKGWVPQAMH